MSLSEPQPSSNTYDLDLIVSDSSNSLTLANATVSIGNVKQFTKTNGAVRFTLAKGEYLLAIMKEGYTPVVEYLTVDADAIINRDLSPKISSTSPSVVYTVTFNITDSVSFEPLANATVAAGDIQQVTGADGMTSLTLPSGANNIIITKDGYLPDTEKLSIDSNFKFEISLSVKEDSQSEVVLKQSVIASLFNPPVAVIGYLLLFTFTACLLVKNEKSKVLSGLGLLVLSMMVFSFFSNRQVTDINFGNMWPWSMEFTSLLIFLFASATMMTYMAGMIGAAKGLSIISSTAVIFSLLNPLLIVTGVQSLLLGLTLGRASSSDAGTRGMLTRVNRTLSWPFAITTVVVMVTGYTLTRLRIASEISLPIHTFLGYTFGALLIAHIVLSLLSGYPWVKIMLGFLRKRNAGTAMLLIQSFTALVLVLLGTMMFISGLSWVNPEFAALIPLKLHVDIDSLLLAVFVVHGGVGIRAFAVRRGIGIPGGDRFIATITSVLALFVFYLAVI
jgi:succinate dehydrogenase hydrophobic anchor subunit